MLLSFGGRSCVVFFCGPLLLGFMLDFIVELQFSSGFQNVRTLVTRKGDDTLSGPIMLKEIPLPGEGFMAFATYYMLMLVFDMSV